MATTSSEIRLVASAPTIPAPRIWPSDERAMIFTKPSVSRSMIGFVTSSNFTRLTSTSSPFWRACSSVSPTAANSGKENTGLGITRQSTFFCPRL